LAGKGADTAGRSVEQDGLATLELIGLAQQDVLCQRKTQSITSITKIS